MDPQRQIIDWLQQDDARMAALRTVRRLGLNDWCTGAGFVPIWCGIGATATWTPRRSTIST